jgi:hypothetical protein
MYPDKVDEANTIVVGLTREESDVSGRYSLPASVYQIGL